MGNGKSTYRVISDVFQTERLVQEPGVQINRSFPTWNQLSLDPFVLFDEFYLEPYGGFPHHAHMGFEKITYLLEGKLRHEDSMGTDIVHHPGDVHRLTAGKEVYHSELALGIPVRGIQLWMNLPRPLKMCEPSVQEVRNAVLPVDRFNGGTMKTLVGPGSPVRLDTSMVMYDIVFESKAQHRLSIEDEQIAVIYPVSGKGVCMDDIPFHTGCSYQLSGVGDIYLLGDAGFRALVIAGVPHQEPIHLWGSFVD